VSGSSRTAQWARWGWLGTTVALAASLMFTSWSNYRSVEQAVATLYTGQAGLFRAALFQVLRESGSDITSADLAASLDELALDGLRYVSIYDEAGNLIARAGTPAYDNPPPDLLQFRQADPTSQGRELREIGSRVRVVDGLRGARPGETVRTGQRIATLFEFEPVVAHGLIAQAFRTLVLAVAAAVLLTVVAIVFWRMSQIREEYERSLEHQRRLAVLGQMSAVLAHEIRNPLASLKGHVQLLAEHLTGTAEGDRAERIAREAIRLETLTTNLLDCARTEEINRTPTDPVELLRTAVEEVEAGDGVDILAHETPERWSLDGVGIRRALTNLLRNALQVSQGGTPIRASVSREGNCLVYEIRDFGPGITAGQEEQIFEPFVTNRATGTGLGLAVASRIVRLHGGAITAKNHVDGGAVFRVDIPQSL